MRNRLGFVLISALIATLAFIAPAHADDTEVNIPDTAFKACIAARLGISPHRAITRTQMATITALQCNRSVDDPAPQIRSLQGWEWLINIRSLNIIGHDLATTTSIPDALTQLQVLDLSWNKLTEVTIPATLTQLQTLHLVWNKLTEVTIPATLTQLRSLDLGYNEQLTSVFIPETLTGLELLGMLDTAVEDLTIPETFSNLKILAVGGDLTHFTIPDTLTKLTELYVTGNSRLTTLTVPSSLTQLRWLALAHNRLTSITIPDTLSSLTYLSLDGNQLTDVKIPETLVYLVELHVAYNQLTNITIPSELYDLRAVRIEYNQLTSIVIPEDLYALKYLYLNSNQLTAVAIPRSLTELVHLNLSDNRLADLSSLSWLGTKVSASEQHLAYPDTETGSPNHLQIRDRQGKSVTITPDIGATVTGSTVIYTTPGTHTLTFNGGVGFDGTITQKAVGPVIPTVPAGSSGVFGDHTGDKTGDLFAIDSSGQLRFYMGSTTSPATYAGVRGTGWNNMTYLTQIDDITGDKRSDLLARLGTNHSLWLYRSTGGGYVTGWKQMGQNWGGMDQIVPVGNLAGGSTQYVVARRASDGKLFRYTLTPNGLTGIKEIGQHWNGMKQILSVGDFNGDGRSDILAIRTSDGTLWRYLGTPQGTIGAGQQVGHGWTNFTRAFTAGDLSGDGIRDLVGQRADGAVFTYTNRKGSWGPARQILTGTQTHKLMA